MESQRTRDRHTSPRNSVRPIRGFTLIELMITVAIIAILAAVAIPSYRDSIWKAKRAEAKSAMLKALQAEERYYTSNNTYIAYTPTTAPTGSFPGFSADNLANSRYTIEVVQAGTAPMCADNDLKKCAIVIARVIGTADPICGASLSMDTIGNKLPALTGSTAACWR